MRVPVVRTVLALGLVALVGCHAGSTAYVSGDGLTTVTSADSTAAACNDLEQRGKSVDLVGSSSAPPAPVGGVMQDGVYVLTSSILHAKGKADGVKLVEMGRITMLVNGAT